MINTILDNEHQHDEIDKRIVNMIRHELTYSRGEVEEMLYEMTLGQKKAWLARNI